MAGITISTLFGDNGIITAARKAAEETEQGEEDTNRKLSGLGNSINDILNGISIVEPKNIEDWKYELDETTNTITITEYKGHDTEVVIPNYIGGVKVKSIGTGYKNGINYNLWSRDICASGMTNYAYGYTQETITKVIISGGIEEIKPYCFSASMALKEAYIPKSVKTIGVGAFGNNLVGATISPNAQIICDHESKPSGWDSNWTNCIFVDWGKAPEIKIVEPKNIEDWEWIEDETTNTITITKYKGEETEVVIPNSIGGKKVKAIGKQTEDISNGFGDYNIWDISICSNNTTNYGYPQETITKVTISDGIKIINISCFGNSKNLKEVIIPKSVKSIGKFSFAGCSNLYNIPDNITNINMGMFWECTGLTNITIPSSVTSIGNSAFSGCTGLTSVTIQNGVTRIEASAFSGCTGLTSVTISSSVTSIGNSAFSGCTGLTSVTISSSVTSIGNYAFADCKGLTNITIPNSVTSIGNSAFSGCIGLTNITIPNSVTSIEGGAFSSCTGLTNITIPSSVRIMGSRVFWNIPSIIVTVPFTSENKPSGWSISWKENYYGTVTVQYQQ